jgi:hypothetical protein
MRRSRGRSSSDDDWCRMLLPDMLFISGQRFVSEHGLSKQWRRRLANPRFLYFSIAYDTWLISVCFNSTPSVPKTCNYGKYASQTITTLTKFIAKVIIISSSTD